MFDLVLEEWVYTFKVNTCEMSVKRVGHIKKISIWEFQSVKFKMKTICLICMVCYADNFQYWSKTSEDKHKITAFQNAIEKKLMGSQI